MNQAFQRVFDRLIESVHAELDEVMRGRADFSAIVGVVPEDDPSFDAQMGYFTNWLLLNRRHSVQRIRPIDAFARDHARELSAEEVGVLEALRGSKYSLYRLAKVKRDFLQLVDAFDNAKYLVDEPEAENLFKRGQYLSCWLLPYQSRHYLLEGRCLHPLEVSKAIEREVKTHPTEGKDEVILRLVARHARCRRFPNFDLQMVYTGRV
ncbi:MAG: hypothetical protein A2284_07830 [Deltaproteobacteria bacterium RIFOXYA12_FULL_61_11]|nr:MAG: hypothetical protein A2284_07830 [Deltaproteobacteria bacterium RIFOXYA12_FULL_61_11]